MHSLWLKLEQKKIYKMTEEMYCCMNIAEIDNAISNTIP